MGYGKAAVILTALVAVLALAPPAMAGTIRYTVPEGADYTVQDNGNGIVKVFFQRCLTEGERASITFQAVTRVTQQSGNATWNVLKEEGEDPTTQFDVNGDGQFDNPPTVFLESGRDNTHQVTISFGFPSPNNGVNMFRIKLDPENGEGLGQGAGIQVRVPCVLAAPPPPPPGGGGNPPPSGEMTQPTAGVLPAATAPQSQQQAPCISVPQRVRARAGERLVLRVRVNTNGTNIQNALVRVIGPGFRQVRRTGSDGIATFTLRPRRAGTIVIQSDVCFGADRIRVAGARRPAARRQPRFTG
jgi:hypothetical protein